MSALTTSPSSTANCRGHERVGGALEHEHLHKVRPLGSYGPSHAHLRPAGCGQHHENEEYEGARLPSR